MAGTKKNMQTVWLYGARFKRPWANFEGKWLHTMSSHQPPGNQWHSTNKAPTIRQCCALKPTYQCSALRPTLVRVFILPTWILRALPFIGLSAYRRRPPFIGLSAYRCRPLWTGHASTLNLMTGKFKGNPENWWLKLWFPLRFSYQSIGLWRCPIQGTAPKSS